eukprot:363045-Chlamydomonas_euryale.AAC.2
MELYIVEFDRLGFLPGEAVTFFDIAEAARALSFTALGYVRGRGANATHVLAPAGATSLVIAPDDRLIIMAEEWN